MSAQLPGGFLSAGLHCGIKSNKEKNDLSLFVSEVPAVVAGVFTQNKVCGAPVVVSRERVTQSAARGVVINSGNANACTGSRGLEDAQWMTAQVASQLNCEPQQVLVCSTGIIGHFLPKPVIEKGVPQVVAQLASTEAALEQAARGMMTTDTFPKLLSRQIEIGGKQVTVTGVAKGAAMIAPNMATMLAVIMTDLTLNEQETDMMLRHAVDRSFNCISVDGHTSTSDTVLLFANGKSGATIVTEDEQDLFQLTLNEVARELSTAIIRDAEGADHFVTVDVTGLRTRDEAFLIAKEISESALVKTAIAGADPNWGRIVSAAGYAKVDFDEKSVSLFLNGTKIYEAGMPVEYDESALSNEIRNHRDVHIELQMNLGDEHVRFWTSDLTQEYVRLNSEYTT
ncbi:Arginine biosynthesis bifunctional protein ArgJ [Polystyrenella longa]|uniref:Arginine biosynthesis bifunctional protein ArgJ n=1 Tax=Polystyrenella longa TaxID=2528007 RepID=A0A518CKN3_9PLAN|nr:bifunctional glutamate N-acetyltransferase/amino-acid acetyltransferase ArgJ [Polystyrenella longa]QDU79778.1 Arginine biosynthesis bifunctional protein ArgJ [Polystyrenella longa]